MSRMDDYWFFPKWMAKEFQFVEFRNKHAYVMRKTIGKLGDMSSHNQSVYRSDFTPLHDLALMYGM